MAALGRFTVDGLVADGGILPNGLTNCILPCALLRPWSLAICATPAVTA